MGRGRVVVGLSGGAARNSHPAPFSGSRYDDLDHKAKKYWHRGWRRDNRFRW